jgi:hypothetical protein
MGTLNSACFSAVVPIRPEDRPLLTEPIQQSSNLSAMVSSGLGGRNLGFMKTHLLFISLLSSVVVLSHLAPFQPSGNTTTPAEAGASPEMNRLAKALAGDWNTTEAMERSELFPNGGWRHGVARVRLGAGGTTLVDEVHSDGSAGTLDGLVIIWWDKGAKLYRFFTCFNDEDRPCEMRGTAHGEGDTLVNDYEERENDKKLILRDSFIQITPGSHTLVMAIVAHDGSLKPLITTTSTRR